MRRVAQWLRAGDFVAAEKALAEARAIAPDHPDVLRAVASVRQRRPLGPSLAELESAAAARPQDVAARIAYGRALCDVGRMSEALAELGEACRIAPSFAPAWFNLGTLEFVRGHTEAARDAFAQAHALAPTHVRTLVGYAETLKMLGEIDAAAEHLRAAVRLAPTGAHAWHSLVNLKTVPLRDEEIAVLERVYARANLDDASRAVAGFALGAALERTGRYGEAYRVFVEANALKRREIEWDAKWFTGVVDTSIEKYSAPIAGVADPAFGSEVIFVVSLPRSGSTLTEQILASHAEVGAGDELRTLPNLIDEESARRDRAYPTWISEATPEDWRRLGEAYLDRTRRWRAEKPRFTDKGLANWQFIGAIRAMLPGARIVHPRRDPVETCWSCFTQWFPVGQPFTYDLAEMAGFWRDYARLMRFWHERYPAAVHDLVYERLVESPEAEIRAMLDACGLPFDPACLEFHATERKIRTPSSAQVREPLRRDTARTARYGAVLDDLRRALDAGP
ncbi:MAG TPA: sulfotransferase [Rhodanobacteraceae bacterium]